MTLPYCDVSLGEETVEESERGVELLHHARREDSILQRDKGAQFQVAGQYQQSKRRMNNLPSLHFLSQNLEKVKEESERREAVMTQIQICVNKSIDQLRMNLQEVEVVTYAELIKSDPKAREAHDKAISRPLPKPTMT